MSGGSTLIIGDNVVLRGYIGIGLGSTIEIGKNTKCNFPIFFICSEGSKLTIGEDCLISDASIYTTDAHSIFDRETKKRINCAKDIIIGDRVWLGRKTWVMKGAVIGDDVVVGACSMVTGDIVSNSICVGSPAKVVKKNTVWCDSKTDKYPERDE